MMSPSDCENFLFSYWSDLHLIAENGVDNGGSSVRMEHTTEVPRESAERLRKIIKFLSSAKSSKIIDQSLSLALLLPVEEAYSKVMDGMNKSEGLNSNADAVMGILSGASNDSASWQSSLVVEGSTEQISLVQEIIEKAKREDHMANRILKYNRLVSNTSVKSQAESDLRCLQAIETRVLEAGNQKGRSHEFGQRNSEENPSYRTARKDDYQCDHPSLTIQGTVSSRQRHQSAFVKRKFPFPNEGPNKQARTLQGRVHNDVLPTQESLRPTDSCSSMEATGIFGGREKRQKPGLIMYNKLDRRENDTEGEVDNQDTDGNQVLQSTNTFMTAHDQYIIDQRKRNGPGSSNEGRSIKSSDYGQTKKSLGTRRGTSNRFVPPVMNRDESRGSTNRRIAYNEKQGTQNTSETDDERLKNIEPRMIEMIENEIMDHGPPIAWDDIAGLEFAKTTIQEIVIWPMLRPDIFTGLRGPPKGLLLFGPPGTGKTLIGKCIASQSRATFFSISASSLTSKWIGEGEKMVRALFSVARCQESAVVFIDEIDSLLSQRTDGEHEATRRIKTEFLVQLDGATTKSEERLLVVGATNRPQELDEAARRRLVKRLYIPLPDGDARKQIVYNLVKEQKCSLSNDDYCRIVENTQGYSGADMANLCREAALGPIRTMSVKDIRSIKSDEVRPMLYEDFEMAFKSIRPSVSQKDLETYIKWNELYGCGAF